MLDRWALRNIVLLSVQWCLGFAAFFIQVSTTSLATSDITGSNSHATIPLGLLLCTSSIVAAFVPWFIARFGATKTFCGAAVLGCLGSVLNFLAVIQSGAQYTLIIMAAVPQGVTYACTNNLRFAVTQFTTPELAPKAIGYVIAGGAFASVIGPEASKYTKDAMKAEYAASYILLFGIYSFMVVIPWFIDFEKKNPDVAHEAEMVENPNPMHNVVSTKNRNESKNESDDSGNHQSVPVEDDLEVSVIEDNKKPEETVVGLRTIREIASRPNFLFILICECISYSAMGGLMAATPLAMDAHGFSFNESTSAIQIHMVGMFVPSLVTGDVMKVLGKVNTMLLGYCLLLLGACLFYIGTSFIDYAFSIMMVGIGWNWSFVPATALFTTLFHPSEKTKILALNDFIVIGVFAIALASVGSVFHETNWDGFISIFLGYITIGLLLVLGYSIWCRVSGKDPDNVAGFET